MGLVEVVKTLEKGYIEIPRNEFMKVVLRNAEITGDYKEYKNVLRRIRVWTGEGYVIRYGFNQSDGTYSTFPIEKKPIGFKR